jgi:hypothetical protein
MKGLAGIQYTSEHHLLCMGTQSTTNEVKLCGHHTTVTGHGHEPIEFSFNPLHKCALICQQNDSLLAIMGMRVFHNLVIKPPVW